MRSLKAAIAALTLATAAIHLWLAFQFPVTDTLFVLNGAGYVGLLVLFLLPLGRFRSVVRVALAAYALLTIFLWVVIASGYATPLAYTDKAIEVLLVAGLVADGLASRKRV